jgi:hypothetical protein
MDYSDFFDIYPDDYSNNVPKMSSGYFKDVDKLTLPYKY